MESLRRVEALPEHLRSSSVGQLGVSNDLRQLPRSDAVAWLEKHVASPVSPHWGGLLYGIGADWTTLERWLRLDKVHCLAACDAIYFYASSVDSKPLLPEGSAPRQIVQAVADAAKTHGSPRLLKVFGTVRATWGQEARTRAQRSEVELFAAAASILLGEDQSLVELWTRRQCISNGSKDDLWQQLVYFSDGKHSVLVADWRIEGLEILERIRALPVMAGINTDELAAGPRDAIAEVLGRLARSLMPHGYSIGRIEMGTDEYVLVVLPEEEMCALESAATTVFGEPFCIDRWTSST